MKRALPPLLAICLLWAGWHFVASQYSETTFPVPWTVLTESWAMRSILIKSSARTVFDALLGLALASVTVVLLAVGFRLSDKVKQFLSPLLLISQLTPKIVIFPVLTLWLSSHMSKVLIVAAFALFPLLDSLEIGRREMSKTLVEQMRLFGATKWQLFSKLEIPHQIPFILSALKVSFIFAFMGAMTVEFYKPSGLGKLINEAFGDSMQYATGWAGIVFSSLTGILGWMTASVIYLIVIRKFYSHKTLILG